QLHGSPLNIRRVVSRICGALFRGSLIATLQQSGIEPVGSKDSRQSLHSQFRSYEAFLENPLPETEQA
ncbi:hypothetical protein, partial [Xanthomonas campestris]|uniref:hypothetical protein n=1 Tax=Xanthomonas campestris TaxID=339 RepID=UPI002B2256F4